MVVRRSVARLLHVRIRNKMVPHKTNLFDPEVEAGCWSARKVQRMPPFCRNTATFTHNTVECTTDSAELNTIASDLWRLCYEHVTNALATNSTKCVHMIPQVQAFAYNWPCCTALRLYCRNKVLNHFDWFTTVRKAGSLQNVISISRNAGYNLVESSFTTLYQLHQLFSM
jgi:hypothetical protein